MLTVKIKGKKKHYFVLLPQRWAEVSAENVVEMMGLTGDDYHTKIAVLKVLFGKQKKLIGRMTSEQVGDFLPHIEWLDHERITEPVVPWFEHEGKGYILPDALLENSTCLEWLLADEYYEDYKAEGKHLDELLATLCRPAASDKADARRRDDIREQLLSRKEVEERAATMAEVDERVKVFVLRFFSGCKEWVFETYKKWLFEEAEEGEEDARPSFLQQLGWYGTFQKVAEMGIFGNLENVLLYTKFKDVCLYLITKKEELWEIERRQKSKRHDHDLE